LPPVPVHWVEHENFNPFWVVTKHADVLDIELHPTEFLNAPRAILGTKEADANRDEVVFTNPFSFDVGRTRNKHLPIRYELV